MQQKAMTRLMGLQFKIIYRKGKENVAVDALSRVAPLNVLQVVSGETTLASGSGQFLHY
jgi:hypothetical protein